MGAFRHKIVSWLSASLLIVLAGSLFARVTQPQEPEAEPTSRSLPILLAELSVLTVEQDPQDDELRKLLKARYNEAVAELRALLGLFQTGQAGIATLPEAAQRVVESGLELTDKPEERIALLTQKVEVMIAIEAVVKAKHAVGAIYVSEVHQARYHRLSAEIQLLRAQR